MNKLDLDMPKYASKETYFDPENVVHVCGRVKSMVWNVVDNGCHRLTAVIVNDKEEIAIRLRDEPAATFYEKIVVGNTIALRGHLHTDGEGHLMLVGDAWAKIQ